MPARFLYLDNLGSPTQWDCTRYEAYVARIRDELPEDLQSLTSEARYRLPSDSDLSLWRSCFTSVEASGERIALAATNDYGTRRFEFVYSGVCKFQTTSTRLGSLPCLVVQELIRLPNGILRHSFSTMFGDVTTIHARSMTFHDARIQ